MYLVKSIFQHLEGGSQDLDVYDSERFLKRCHFLSLDFAALPQYNDNLPQEVVRSELLIRSRGWRKTGEKFEVVGSSTRTAKQQDSAARCHEQCFSIDKLESITRRTGLSLQRREVLLQLSVEHGPYVPGRDCNGAHILDKAHTLPKDSETCTSNKAVQLEVGQLLVERILHPD
ncbi:hypothetical protein C8J55DRAFT_547284 [Lentinula edodes]|uniref:Uncharacterized protein n=1 Tax=Lentinula lateritia TaxID=40482 RepID=A0A9W9AVG8_9AGAR|nr:hypothetical protein C8J55DRAFT_547284 [Lentinula edodes]